MVDQCTGDQCMEGPFLVALCHLECDHLDFRIKCQDHHHINQAWAHQGCLQDLAYLATFKGHRPSWDLCRKALEEGLLVDPLQEGEWDSLDHTQAVGHL